MTQDILNKINKNRERFNDLTIVLKHGVMRFEMEGRDGIIVETFNKESTLIKEVRTAIEKEIKRLNIEFEGM